MWLESSASVSYSSPAGCTRAAWPPAPAPLHGSSLMPQEYMSGWMVDKVKQFFVLWRLLEKLNGCVAQAFGRNAARATGSEALMSVQTVEAPTGTARREGAVSPWLVLVLVGLAQFMVILDATVVNVALPSIQRALH